MENESQVRILYLYQLLLKYSDAEHPLNTQQILQMMEEKHNLKLYRSTVPTYVKILNDCGLEVMTVRSRTKLYYVADRVFDLPELKLLIDAVESSRIIPDAKTNELVAKLVHLASDADANKLERSLYTSAGVKSANSQIMYIIDAIYTAMHEKKQISFVYMDYDQRKRPVARNNGEPYIVSPFRLIWNGDYYYLVGFCHSRGEIRTFRVDHIKSAPELTADEAAPEPKKFDPAVYSKQVFRMFSTDKPVKVTLLCENSLMKHVIDQFGEDVKTTAAGKEHFRVRPKVCASPTFYRWVFGWGTKMKIEGPEKVVQEYRGMLQQALEACE